MKVSVAVPSKNQGRFIGDAIDSILNQRFPGTVEVIVRDCMSDDETPAVLACYETHPAVKIVRQLDDGQSDALARAFNAASGDVFVWLNSDDVWFPHTLKRVSEAFEQDPNADVVYGEAVFLNEAGITVDTFPTARPTLRRLRDRCVISQPSVFFRRNAYFDVGGITASRRFCMDYELWIRLLLAGRRFAYSPHVLSGTRLHPQTKTAGGGLAFVEEICRMQEELLGGVSPVWRIYRRSRSPELAHIRDKRTRFVTAALQEIRTSPWQLGRIAAAFAERTIAQRTARVRVRGTA